MRANDQLTRQMRLRQQTTSMGLGLVRLLLDAGRTEEARTTLASLQHGFQSVASEGAKPSQKRGQGNRLKAVSRRCLLMPLSAELELVQ
jgi:hypothetical protein